MSQVAWFLHGSRLRDVLDLIIINRCQRQISYNPIIHLSERSQDLRSIVAYPLHNLAQRSRLIEPLPPPYTGTPLNPHGQIHSSSLEVWIVGNSHFRNFISEMKILPSNYHPLTPWCPTLRIFRKWDVMYKMISGATFLMLKSYLHIIVKKHHASTYY